MTTKFNIAEIKAINLLIVENKNSEKLQKLTGLSYMDSIHLGNKIDKMIEEYNKEQWLESQKENYSISYDSKTDENIIVDNINDIEYRIHRDLVDSGKVAQYMVEDRASRIYDLEKFFIPEASDESMKVLMKEDLETLENSDDENVFANYGTNGFITKEDIEVFNSVCLEMIESFKDYKKENKKKK